MASDTPRMADADAERTTRTGDGPPLFEVVLVEPEIPNNTGNIGRTCVALGCSLHLVHPLGFDLSVKACRRAGLDYWPRLRLTEHADLRGYLDSERSVRRWFLTTSTSRSIFDADLRPGDHLVFGSETAGLPDDLLEQESTRVVALPMLVGERSLNLATVVCAVLYEGLRQCLTRREVSLDTDGRVVSGSWNHLSGGDRRCSEQSACSDRMEG